MLCDDSTIKVVTPSGVTEWKGIVDDCPYKGLSWEWDSKRNGFVVRNPDDSNDYRIIMVMK